MIYSHFWLLAFCTIMKPGTDYCYDNVFADVTLEGGHPGLESAYGVVDWYTWSGWLEAVVFHYAVSWTKSYLMSLMVIGVFMSFMLTSNVPFCVDGDIEMYGVDVCAVLTFLKV